MNARRRWLALLPATAALALLTPGVRAQVGTISTIAGGGPNNLPKLSANIGFIFGIARDPSSNFYLVAPDSARVFKISSTGTLTIFAGTGIDGYSGDGGPATSAQVGAPEGVAADTVGNVFIADTNNAVIRMVNAAGTISTVAGNTTDTLCANALNNLGDGCPATSSYLGEPIDVFVDAAGDIFISDVFDYRVREVFCANTAVTCTPPTGFTAGDIYTVAGGATANCANATDSIGDNCPATAAMLFGPQGLFVDGSGNLYIADTVNSVIREVSAATGIIQTIAGTPKSAGYSGDNGPAVSAQLSYPYDVFVDGSGDIFIADTDNQRIREVGGPASGFSGTIKTVVGGGTGCAAETDVYGDGCPATAAILEYPEGLALDSTGDLFIADTSDELIREVSGGTIEVYAGNGTSSYSGDGFPATDGALNDPDSVSVDQSGDIFIADSENQIIREVNGSTTNLSTFAGTPGQENEELCDPPITGSQFCVPMGVLVDAFGNVFIADSLDEVVWEVPAGSNQINLIAGLNDEEICNDTTLGDGCPATMAVLSTPEGLAIDSAGNLYIADSRDDVIRVVYCVNPALTCTPPTGFQAGYINTVAGTPQDYGYGGDGGPATSAQLAYPTGVTVDLAGNLYIADNQNGILREVPSVMSASPTIMTIAGTPDEYGYTGDGGPPTSATLSGPADVKVDAAGNIFFSDCEVASEGPCNDVIQEIPAATGLLQTIAGMNVDGEGVYGFSGDGGPATSATFEEPGGLAFDAAGDLLVADIYNGRIRSIAGVATVVVAAASPATEPFGSVPENTTAAPVTVTLTNNGLFPLNFTSAPLISVVTGNMDFSISGGTCAMGTPVAAYGGTCTVVVSYTPSLLGSESATLNFADNALPATQTVMLSGTGIAAEFMTSPGSLAFGNQPEGTTSAPLTLMFINAGNIPLMITGGLTPTGTNANDFAQVAGAGTCGTLPITVAANNGTCTVQYTFTPRAVPAGGETATLMVADNAAASPQMVMLSGTGTQPAVGPLASQAFGTVPIGTPSGTVTVTVMNTGTAPLNFTAISVTGTSPANNTDFTVTGGTCMVGTAAAPSPVAPEGSCTITLVFKPTAMPAAGMTTVAETATLSLTDNAPGSPQTAMLSGTGTLPVVTFNPTAMVGLNLGAIAPGTTSTMTETVTVAAGSGNLQISLIQVVNPEETNAFAITGGTCPTDGGTVTAGSGCTVIVQFTAPQTTGTYNGSLEFVGTNLVGSPVNIPLAGTSSTGPPLTLTAMGQNGANGATITLLPGDTGTYTIIVQPGPQFTGTITISCQEVTPIPATILTATPATINVTTAPSGAIVVKCTLQTNCNTSLVGPKPPSNAPPWTGPPVGVVLLLAMLIAMHRNRRSSGESRGWAGQMAPALGMVLMLVLLLSWTACVNNPAPAIPNAPTTPAGVYQIQVVATVTATGQTVTLPLTVHII